MSNTNRPDLSERSILLLDGCVFAFAVLVLAWPEMPAPGSAKRSGFAENPPAWFIAHVLATSLGSGLIFIHVVSGDWLTPPGLVLALLLFLLIQGSLIRVVLARGFSLLFARSSAVQGFTAPPGLNRNALQRVIDDKVELLARLDANADEALFSPALKHWLRQPRNSLRYHRLAERETRMVGARAGAGVVLAWSRRIHMMAALAFYLSLVAHIIVVLFFAWLRCPGRRYRMVVYHRLGWLRYAGE